MNTSKSQQNIPSGWALIKVGDIGSTYSGLRSKSKSDFGHGSPFITYMNIFSNSKIDKNRFGLVNIGVDENQNKVKYGDVFFTVSSETPEEVGMSSVLLDEVDNYYLNSFCFGFRLNDFDSLTPQYARYLFRGNDFRSKIVKMAQGSTRFNLSKERVLSLDIKLPPLKEQQKIAEILETVDEDIAKTLEVIEATEKLKRGLMQQLFTRGINDDISELELGKISKVTSSKRIMRSEYVEEGIPFYRSKEVIEKAKGIKHDSVFYISKERYHEIEKKFGAPHIGDILMTAVGTIGVVYLVDEEGFYFKDGNLLWIKDIDKSLDRSYLKYYMNSEIFQKRLLGTAIGSNQKALTIEKVEKVIVPIPKLPEQQKIAEILSAVDEKISVNKKLKVKLTILKKGLMQDLLSGMVRTNI